jgi:hypothetical protein
MMQRIINELRLPIIVIDLQKRQLTAATTTITNTNNRMTNSGIIMNYFEAMKIEINPSINYVKTNQNTLDFHNNKSLTEITRGDIVDYLNSLKKLEEIDPLHK